MSHPIENIIKTTMENLQTLINVNTIVGSPVRVDNNTMVIPVSRVSLGFISGGGEYPTKNAVERSGRSLEDSDSGAKQPFAGTTAAGICVSPVSFLSVQNGQVGVLPAKSSGCMLERMIDNIPQILRALEQMIASLQKARRVQDE